LARDLVRVGKSLERMLTAYQEDLVSLEQLRERMPLLRQREQALRTELQSIANQTRERTVYLRLDETLSMFLGRLRMAADTLDVVERQRIVRLVVKEVLVDDDTIVIRHCIPVPSEPSNGTGAPTSDHSGPRDERSYLLRSVSNDAALWNALSTRRFQNQSQEPQHRIVVNPTSHFRQDEVMSHRVEIGPQVQVDDVGFALQDCLRHASDRRMR
jgi:site-specific DNA recombinase